MDEGPERRQPPPPPPAVGQPTSWPLLKAGDTTAPGAEPTPGVMHVEAEDAEGPPPPPFVRRRRRRRNLAIAAAASIIVGVPLVLAVVSSAEQGRSSTDADDPPAASDGPGSDQPEDDGADREGSTGGGAADDGDGSVQGGDGIERPDTDQFDGADAVYAELLRDIDDSERSMIGFQDALSDAFAGVAGDGDDLVDAVQAAAEEARDDLLEVRGRLIDELAEDGAEAVRETYLDHLDSWAEYMAAVESDPGILGAEDRTRVFTLAINVTADAFARTLDQELPSDVDDEVRQYADAILDRGFRGFSEPNV